MSNIGVFRKSFLPPEIVNPANGILGLGSGDSFRDLQIRTWDKI